LSVRLNRRKKAVVHGVAGLVGRHLPGLDFVLGGPAEGGVRLWPENEG
jgi:hypothetical protein